MHNTVCIEAKFKFSVGNNDAFCCGKFCCLIVKIDGRIAYLVSHICPNNFLCFSK